MIKRRAPRLALIFQHIVAFFVAFFSRMIRAGQLGTRTACPILGVFGRTLPA
jgi:hypothetical protein